MPIKLNSSGGGSVTLDVPSTASDFTATMPANTGTVITTGSTAAVTQGMLASGVVGNGPAFGAYSNVATSLSAGVSTKILFQVEEFDTDSNFSSSRFTPSVAGYYQINSGVQFNGTTTASIAIHKNGSLFKYGNYMGASGTFSIVVISSLLYLNGTSDYVEIYCNSSATLSTSPSQAGSYFNGFLARAA